MMKKNFKRIVYGIGMGLVWGAALTGMLNSPIGAVIGAGLGCSMPGWDRMPPSRTAGRRTADAHFAIELIERRKDPL